MPKVTRQVGDPLPGSSPLVLRPPQPCGRAGLRVEGGRGRTDPSHTPQATVRRRGRVCQQSL